MLDTTANFDAIHDLLYKKPVYIVHFDGEAVDYCNHNPGSPDNTCKLYLIDISGSGQKVTPEEGIGEIGNIKVQILDVDDEMTALWATDTDAYFHRRATTIKAGYKGLNEADFATIMTAGRITGMRLSSDGLAWMLDITDPRKYEQERIFLDSEDTTLTIQGNPIDILLSIYLSSDTPGTNHAFYDRYGAGNGLNLTTDDVDVTGLEAIRDGWFPGCSHYMRFTITERETAGDFITSQIRKVLNLRPALTADGKLTEKVYKPPLADSGSVQTFDESNIIGLPQYDANLQAVVNRVEFHSDYDGDGYQTQDYYVDATSLLNRGPGKKPIIIKSRGLRTSMSPGSLNSHALAVIESRKSSIFQRFAKPPTKLTVKTFFTKWLTEAGDIVPFTHSKTPDIVAGTRGMSNTRLEVIDRQIKWKTGEVTITLLDTGYDQRIYGVCSPIMTVTSGTSGTEFAVSTADATRWANFTLPEARVVDAKGRSQAHPITILTINTSTGAVTCDDIGATPSAGWVIIFADYDSCTAGQKLYGYASDGSDYLGAANDDAHICTP